MVLNSSARDGWCFDAEKASKWFVICLFTLLNTSIEFAVNISARTVRKFNRSIWLHCKIVIVIVYSP